MAAVVNQGDATWRLPVTLCQVELPAPLSGALTRRIEKVFGVRLRRLDDERRTVLGAKQLLDSPTVSFRVIRNSDRVSILITATEPLGVVPKVVFDHMMAAVRFAALDFDVRPVPASTDEKKTESLSDVVEELHELRATVADLAQTVSFLAGVTSPDSDASPGESGQRSAGLGKVFGAGQELLGPELQATAAWLASVQDADGMIPWFPGSHADVWTHSYAAMALGIAGHAEAADRAWRWLERAQRPDGSWHEYYRSSGRVESPKVDTNHCAFVATLAWHRYLLGGGRDFAQRSWTVVEKSLDYVLELRTPRGEVLYGRHADGTPWSYALLAGNSSIHRSLECGIQLGQVLGHERPDWELSSMALRRTLRHSPADAFAPKRRYALDWFYPVLSGAFSKTECRDRLQAHEADFVFEDRGIRCVSDRPWVTTAETAEAAIAYFESGNRKMAERLLKATSLYRDADGAYSTGMVFPEATRFPDEQTAYSAAAVIVATDCLRRLSPAAAIFSVPDVVDELAPVGR